MNVNANVGIIIHLLGLQNSCSMFSTLIMPHPTNLQLSTSTLLWASGRAKIIVSTSTSNKGREVQDKNLNVFFVQIDFIFHMNIKLLFVFYL